uniref:Global nitrogen transcriptional regulator n=1 Tax=Leiomenia cribrosa TaxID=217483 RepID=A0A4D6WXP7_9FLOR|nr:global nitrogen transcriptional regulator [Leiomenia cribrosa]
MQWINHFSQNKIAFYIYKLNKGDSLIYQKNKKYNNSSIILNGIVFLLKIFTNKEIISLGILTTNNILPDINNEIYYYYKIIAIETTFLLSFKWSDIVYNKKIKKQLLQNIIISYQLTLNKYEIMNHIYSHKYMQYRLIQLIIFLSKEFGFFKNQQLIIPFKISQITISILIGTNRSNVNKIIKKLYKMRLISYYNQKKIYIKNPFLLNYYAIKSNIK